jgi:signal transduction histidine kinase
LEAQSQTLLWLIRIRWIFIILVSLWAVNLGPQMPPQTSEWIWAVLLTASALNLIYHALSRFPKMTVSLISFLFLMDGLLIGPWVALTGGPVSPYVPFYLFLILAVCLTVPPREAIWISGWQILSFLVTMTICYRSQPASLFASGRASAFSAILEGATSDLRRELYLEQTVRWTVFLALTMLISGVLVRQVWNREEKLRLKERDLEQNRRLIQLGELTGRIAHGVNTPLGLISGNLEMLMAETRPRSHTYRRLSQIEKYVQRAIKTVRNVLDYNRQTMSQIRPVSLPKVIRAVAEAVQPKLKKAGGKLALDVDPRIPSLLAYTEGVFQALLNLVENAIDSISPGGTVSLSARFQYHSLRLSSQDRRGIVKIVVSDTGRGIPPEELKRIFEPFYSTKGFGKGTGLGLAIVKRVVDEHQGEIKVESREGEGTRFTLLLPTDFPSSLDSSKKGQPDKPYSPFNPD